MLRCPRNCSRRTNPKVSKKRVRSWIAGWAAHKKKPRWALVAAIGADQPGMGMTNRVFPLREKSGERLEALNWLDGDGSRKFQSFECQFFKRQSFKKMR